MTLEEALALASQYHAAGQLAWAEQLYQLILQSQPGNAAILHRLGVIAGQRGQCDLGVNYLRRALAIAPQEAYFHSSLALIYQHMGRMEDATASATEAVRLKPGYAEGHYNLGLVLGKQGRFPEAEAAYREALRLRPDLLEAYTNLGALLIEQRRFQEAEAFCHQALRLNPNCPLALTNLGRVRKKQGRLPEAETCLQEALRIQPNLQEAHTNLGLVRDVQGRLREAEACYREALRLQPDNAECYYNLAVVLQKRSKLSEAEICLRDAVRLRPDFVDAHDNLGAALLVQGRVSEAMDRFRLALRLDPTGARVGGNLLMCTNYDPGIGPAEALAEHRAWVARHAPAAAAHRPHANDPSPERRLRVGYVAPDLRLHSVAFYFMDPILTHHDSRQVEVFCYEEVNNPDAAIHRRFQNHHWRSTCRLSHDRVAELIRDDGIDLLVDLAGHTANNRLLVFARKPAPVQVTYMGYPNTTGLKAMDYRLTDAIADPLGMTESHHAEQLVRLPETFLCYSPPADGPPTEGLPLRAHTRITFGSFSFLPKLNSAVVAAWSELLKAVPDSRLLLKYHGLGDEAVRESVRDWFAAQGIGAGRLQLSGPDPALSAHLARYREVDVALDTFPYNGTTTICEALWMGVPVVTLAGDRHAARVGASLLTCVGLPELIAQTPDDYIGIARRLAEDRERLAQLRSTLRERVRASPLCDGKAFTRRLEEAYREMWRRWCAEVRA